MGKYISCRLILIILTQLVITEVFAGGLDNFMKFGAQGGSMTSVNKGAVISDQKAGYMTGGSIISRGPRPMDLQPLGVQLPSFDLDPCTGSFDLRFGGFSYIKGPELAKYFKAVATGSATYLVKMAITQACPQCEGAMSDLEAIARDINGMTFNQCEQGKAIAEGLIGKFNAATTQKCLAKSSLARGGSDLHEATQNCQDDPDRYGETGDNAELKSMLPDNFNLVWHALSHGSGEAPSGMKEMIMSISGSIIGIRQGGVTTISTLPSLLEKNDLLEQYMGKPGAGSSKVKLYVCDETTRCLRPIVQEMELDNREGTLYGKVEVTLQSILDKIDRNAGALTDEEQALIEYSQIPIITLFEIELALKNKESVSLFAGNSEFIEVVCYDMVTNFMQKMLHEAKTAVGSIETAQVDNTAIERFNKNLKNVQSLLRDKKYKAMDKLQTIIAVKERLTKQQDVFEMNFTRYGNSRGR
ncbi:MAG: conjugal transfer protein TraH [Candidatus Parvarchaeum sp.]